jgi:hypothetical protein
MACLLAGRQESLGGYYEVRDFWSGELMMPNTRTIDDMTGLPIVARTAAQLHANGKA